MSTKKLRVKLVKSPFGTGKRHMACARGLGLRRLHQERELQDTPAVRGILRRIGYMVTYEEI